MRTPGEWNIGELQTDIWSEGRLVANCGGWVLTQHEVETIKENRANAEFIVRAVNAYDDLVDALKLALNYFGADSEDEEQWDNEGYPTPERQIRHIIEAAIAQVDKGK